MRNTFHRGALASIAALLPGLADAQQQRADSARADSAARRIESVVVTSARTPAAVGGASTVEIHTAALTVSPAPSLEQVLRETPFVLVRQNSRGETELSVRGSDSRQTAVLLDGVPLTLGWDHRSDPSLVPLTGVRRLTLVRGLSSLTTGPNVLGGVVEAELAGGATPTDPSRGPTVSLGTSVDQYAARVLGASGAAPMRVGSGVLTLRGGAAYHEREGFALGSASAAGGRGGGRPGEGEDPGQPDDPDLRTNSDLRQVDAFAALRWEMRGGRHVGLAVAGYDAHRGVPPELHVSDPRLWRYPDLSRTIGILSAGTGPVRSPLGWATVALSGGIDRGEQRIESFADRAYDEVVGEERGDERTVTARVVATHTLPASGELRAALTHAAVRYDERIDDDPASRYRQRLTSAAAEAQWPVLSRATVSGGVVYDAATTPETGGKPSLGRLSDWGWRLGASLPVGAERLRLHASVSERARFPALRELYSGSLGRFEPNPELRPERLLGAEVGATLAGDASRAGLTFQAVAFHHRLQDAVVRISTPEGMFRRVNRDEIRSSGVELLAEWRPAAPGWLGELSLSGDFMAQRVRLYDRAVAAGSASARRAEHQPELRGSLELGAPLPLRVRGIATARYTGRQYCVHPDLDAQVALRAQTVADVALVRSWPLSGSGLLRRLRSVLALDNVSDATVYDQCGLPQPGRTLRLSLEIG
ncbi:MAG TPA: TonB-dependent receptor [Gemmatimonadaceae bacterium]|nr:TonB-dependent receptor [Gemmatimonadaceae bacterium]